MKPDTKLITLGRDPEANFGAVNPPLYRTSTVIFPTLDDYDAAKKGTYKYSTYGRYGTPTTQGLEDALAELEGADHTMLTSSGVSAFTTVLLALLSAGDHLLMADSVYDPTRRFCDHELKRLGVETTYYDPTIGAGIKALIRDNTKVVFVESPGSLTFEMQDIPAIAREAHARGALVVSDSTWATPLFFRPFEKGVDVSIHSATKYINGHSDVVMGVISTTKTHYTRILNTHKNLGACPNAGDAYLAQRGLRTMGARLRIQQESALKVAAWLRDRPEVVEVRYPALPGAPGYDLWKRDFTGASALFTILTKPYTRPQLAAMLDGMKLLKMGYSWGGYESLMIPIDPTAIRTATPWTHKGATLRLHIGLEDVGDLISDLEEGFSRANSK
ncbi:MAG: cystathionine beta-lyase [Alphaproteobacteria bacterium]|nr:cystathionine beta-lyase [Alphaproteobacteria bacterium]